MQHLKVQVWLHQGVVFFLLVLSDLCDHGFLNRGWKRVEFQSAVGPILKAGGLGYKDMGHYTFVDGDGNATRADYTFAYHKLDGRVLISLHHSSLSWLPPGDI